MSKFRSARKRLSLAELLLPAVSCASACADRYWKPSWARNVKPTAVTSLGRVAGPAEARAFYEDILRSLGVEIGKRDFMGPPPA